MNTFWQDKRQKYETADWASRPSLFAEFVLPYVASGGSMLELGAGLGQDSVYFATHGYDVTSTDLVLDTSLAMPETVKREQIDISQPFPYGNAQFDVAYAHLALHYFDNATTQQVFREIYRVLKPGGMLAFLANSTSDPECSTGVRLEDNYYETAGTKKRYFDVPMARSFAREFEEILCDDQGETYKDQAKGVHNLLRYIGRKLV